MQIILATTNLHKLREIRSMLHDLPQIELLSLWDFPNYQQPPEVGEDCRANAEIKALHAAQELGCWVIADDSGLVVPALNGEPGVRSARYAGEEATDRDNRKKLLQQMTELTGLQRQAYFECWLSLAHPDHGIFKSLCGLVEGEILTEERGAQGFGYDPLFLKHGYSKTFAEISDEIKNRISHRAQAIDKLRILLEGLLFREKTDLSDS